MSIEHAVEFCERLGSDREIHDRAAELVEAGAAPLDLLRLGAAHGLDFTVEEMESAVRASGQLSDEQLQGVAGGLRLDQKSNRAFDLMTNFIKRMQDSRSSLLGDFR